MTGPIAKGFQVQSVVFDLFHTLVDPDVYRPEGFTRAYKIAEALGLAEADEFARYWDEVEARRHVDGSKKVAQYADDYLFEHRGRRCTPEELDQVNLLWGRMHDLALLKPRDDVVSALRNLHARGLKLGLLSNIDEREAVNWTSSPLSPLFDVACLSFEIGHSKPSREAYSLVLTRLGADASSSIYVGDGSHDELAGAKRAGFGLVVLMKGFISGEGKRSADVLNKRQAVADETIMGIGEIGALVDRLQA
ncbi:MAG: HAD hydrolase-like protein [Thaumarchaeota archaeon]|nr:HAD hydrolase-like protein [Nitrososphaerota archaeon]